MADEPGGELELRETRGIRALALLLVGPLVAWSVGRALATGLLPAAVREVVSAVRRLVGGPIRLIRSVFGAVASVAALLARILQRVVAPVRFLVERLRAVARLVRALARAVRAPFSRLWVAARGAVRLVLLPIRAVGAGAAALVRRIAVPVHAIARLAGRGMRLWWSLLRALGRRIVVAGRVGSRWVGMVVRVVLCPLVALVGRIAVVIRAVLGALVWPLGRLLRAVRAIVGRVWRLLVALARAGRRLSLRVLVRPAERLLAAIGTVAAAAGRLLARAGRSVAGLLAAATRMGAAWTHACLHAVSRLATVVLRPLGYLLERARLSSIRVLTVAARCLAAARTLVRGGSRWAIAAGRLIRRFLLRPFGAPVRLARRLIGGVAARLATRIGVLRWRISAARLAASARVRALAAAVRRARA